MDIPQLYHEWTLRIGTSTGLADPLLHLHAGMAILVLVRLVSRRSLGTFIPFWFVVAAELGNEVLDYLAYGPLWQDTLSDIANTLFWPFVISLGVRLRPMIADRAERQSGPMQSRPMQSPADDPANRAAPAAQCETALPASLSPPSR